MPGGSSLQQESRRQEPPKKCVPRLEPRNKDHKHHATETSTIAFNTPVSGRVKDSNSATMF